MSLEDVSYEQRDQLAALMRELSDNPATRKEVLRLTKKIKPDLVIPELEIEETTNSAVSEARKELDGLKAQLAQRQAEEDLEKRRNSLIRKGLAQSDADVEEIEKVMLEKKIADHDTAAEYWQWMKQSAAPTPTGYNPSAVSKFDLNKYYKNPVGAARDEAAKALQELRKNTRPIGF
jgi:Sec-independent protein translocase protein TatA